MIACRSLPRPKREARREPAREGDPSPSIHRSGLGFFVGCSMTEKYAPYGKAGSRARRVVLVLREARATDAVEGLRRAGFRREALPLLTVQDTDRAELHFPEPETAALTAALLVLQGRDFEAKGEVSGVRGESESRGRESEDSP